MFYENIYFLNPNVIETISILNGTFASVIYGVKAANGVGVIENKSNSYHQGPEIVYDGYHGMQAPQNVLKMPNAQQFVRYINETGVPADLPFIQNAMQLYGRSRIDPNLPMSIRIGIR